MRRGPGCWISSVRVSLGAGPDSCGLGVFSKRDRAICARAFQRGVVLGICDTVAVLREKLSLETVVLSGGVFQNELLMDIRSLSDLEVWTNSSVPPNDGGISLGQAAFAHLKMKHA